jgi:cardiolipin synthase
LRAGLRRHGVVPRPADLRRRLRAADVHFTDGNAIELFPDGVAGLSAMLEAIAGATKRIHLETYILRADETGARFLRALSERARAGVEVRVLFDAFGSLGLDPAALADLRAAGGDAVAFNPLSRFYPRWAPRRRDHRKILVVDGEVAFTGGLNIGDEYFHGASFQGQARRPWRDAHVRVTGPVVGMLEAVFLESWFRADGPDCSSAEPAASPAVGGEAVAVLADGPTYHRRRLRDLLVSALKRSHRHARLVTPYFIPGARLREALAATAARGVEVEVVIAGYVDHPVVRWAAYGMLPQLLARGVRVYEYERSMMHAKAAVFDEGLAVLGTSNLDRQSLQHSY